jgi:hypothetical protein
MKGSTALLAALFIFYFHVNAQTLYVDSTIGSLQKAVSLANQNAKGVPVTIKIAPGLYLLSSVLKIESLQRDSARYILEAMVMPDDSNWTPASMPVIQSISGNNNRKPFNHCTGIDVERANTTIRGLKFVGNANPGVEYYYPIERDTTLLENLHISQCYFIGDRYGSVVQGAIWAQGPGIHIDHCIMYGCKNAVLSFLNPRDFSLTHTIIYGAYECAVWYGCNKDTKPEDPFIFRDNIVTRCNYFWGGSEDHDHGYYTFNHSLICDNDHYVGIWTANGGVEPIKRDETYHETNIRKSGTVKLVEVKTEGLPKRYLNLAPDSDGLDTEAGIFKSVQ